MYAVIRYFNYRKEVSFTILKTFTSLTKADKCALQYAEDDYGEDVVQGVSERWVYVDEEIDGYTKGDGYDRFVYTVIELPEPEDEESEEESELEDETGFEIKKQKNGKYEWGFDLTDFNEESDEDEDPKVDKKEWVKNFMLNEKHDYEDPYDSEDEEGIEIVFQQEYKRDKGASKFQELLDTFDMELVSKSDKGFMWENKGSILMVTANNPLTGEYCNGGRNNEKGYLSYVGVSCESPQLLQEFINEFRQKASYVKGESNCREYI